MVKLDDILAEAKAVALAESIHEGGFYHLHPFLNTFQHIPADSPKSITEFVKESLALLIESGLL